jgi:phosphoribosylamine--glycine ligase
MEKKRKFLFVSLTGLVGDIAWQVLKEGHEVRYFIGDAEEKDIADGFVPKTDDWEKDVDWADVIVFDDTLGQGEKAVALRAKGRRRRRHALHRPLEDDRSFAGAQEGRVTMSPTATSTTSTKRSPTSGRTRRATSSAVRRASNVKRRLFVGGGRRRGPDRAYKKPSPTRSGLQLESGSSGSGRRRQVLQRQELRLPDQHELRAQETLPGQQRTADRRDGHDDVLERAQ